MGEVLLKGSKTTISPVLFKKLRDEGEFFDVTLVPGNETYGGTHVNAHKVILSAFSPVFKDMLRGTPHTISPMIFLRDIDYEELVMLMDYIYNGEVSLNETKLDRFLNFANDLKIQGLDVSSAADYRSRSTPTPAIRLHNHLSRDNASGMGVRSSSRINSPHPEEDLDDFPASEDIILCEELKREIEDPYEDYPFPKEADLSIDREIEMLDCEDGFLHAKNNGFRKKSPEFPGDESLDYPFSSSPPPHVFHCNESATYGKTQRGRPMLIDNTGYVYVCEKKGVERTYWNCKNRKSSKCPSRAHTDQNGDIVKRLHEHNHGPNRHEFNAC